MLIKSSCAAQLVVIAPLLSLAGCSFDYLNRRDSVTLAAGNAQAWNRAIHTIDPWPPEATDTSIESNGPRAGAVVRAHQNPRGAPTQPPAGATNLESNVSTAAGLVGR